MFKKSENPISLFSFQDIITSLIGIMLLILLIMCIELLTKVETKETNQSKKQEMEQLKQEKQKLLQQEVAIRKQIQKNRNNIRNLTFDTPYELERKQQMLKEKLTEAQKTKKEKQKEQEELEKRFQTVESEKKEQQNNASLKENQNKVNKLKENIRELEQKKSNLKQQLHTKKLEISVNSSSNSTPLITILSGSEIIVKIPSENKVIWKFKNNAIETHHISQLMTKLSGYAWKKYHFVFLIKPSAARVSMELEYKFKEKFRNEEYGIEPIYEDEDIE